MTREFELTSALLREADRLGIDACGVCAAEPYVSTELAMAERRERGFFADMRFTIANHDRSCHPETLLRNAASVVAVAQSYARPEPRQAGRRTARPAAALHPARRVRAAARPAARPGTAPAGTRARARGLPCTSTPTSTSIAKPPPVRGSPCTARTRWRSPAGTVRGWCSERSSPTRCWRRRARPNSRPGMPAVRAGPASTPVRPTRSWPTVCWTPAAASRISRSRAPTRCLRRAVRGSGVRL